jgi:hypothetical protein
VCVSGGCLHVFAHPNAAVTGVNPLVPSSAWGVPITKAIRAQLKKLIRPNKTRDDFAEKFEELIESDNQGSRNIEDWFEALLVLNWRQNHPPVTSLGSPSRTCWTPACQTCAWAKRRQAMVFASRVGFVQGVCSGCAA